MFTHQLAEIAKHDEKWGYIRAVIASSSNWIILCMTEENFNSMRGANRLVMNGKIMLEYDAFFRNDVEFAFAPDGYFAYAKAYTDADGKKTWKIWKRHDSQPITIPLDTLHHLVWLPGETLAWSGYNEEEKGEVPYFVDGVEMTGKLKFRPILWGYMYSAVEITDFENNRHYQYRDDGAIVECDHEKRLDCESEENPRLIQNNEREKTAISYKGVVGPEFDGIERNGGIALWTFNDDGSKIAYCGIKNPPWSRTAGKIVRYILDKYEEKNTHGLKKILYGCGAWPIMILANPYFGPLHYVEEARKRWIPVNNGIPWQKQYKFACWPFFTRFDNLVVSAIIGKHWHVVVDEKAGPPFDEIYNVRPSRCDNELVSYIGRRENTLFRVNIKQ